MIALADRINPTIEPSKTGPQGDTGGGENGDLMNVMRQLGIGPNQCTVDSPGYGEVPPFSPEQAREIAEFPAVAFGMNIYNSPIIGNPVEWKKVNDDVPDDWLQAVQAQFDPMMPEIKEAMLAARKYDWSPNEIVWTEYAVLNEKPELWIDRIKPLTVEYTWLLHDRHGEVVGLKNQPPNQKPTFLEPYQSLVWIYNNEPQWPYGRGITRNLRYSWWQAKKTHEKIGQFSTRAANLLLLLQYPLGMIRNAAGAPWPAQWFARDLLKSAMGGIGGLAVPNSYMTLPDEKGGNKMTGKDIEALAKATPWKMEAFSQGNLSELRGAVEYLMYLDGEIFRGIMLSPRVGLESIHGSRADSQTHTDTFIQSAQRDDEKICRVLNRTLVSYFLEARFGPKAVGAIRATSQQISNEKAKDANDLLKAFIASPTTGPVMERLIDVQALCDIADVPTLENVDVEDIRTQLDQKEAAQAKAAQAAAPEPAAGGKPEKPEPEAPANKKE